MAAVWEQRFAEYVRRLLSLRESTALEALPDLMPVLPVIDPGAPEAALLRRERRFAASFTSAAAAGNYSRVSLELEAARTNVVLVIEDILAWEGTGPFRTIVAGTTIGGGTGGKNLDMRGGATGAFTGAQSHGTVVGGNTAGLDGSFHWRSTAALAGYPQPPIILTPGTRLTVQNETANNQLSVSFTWRERVVDPAELVPTGV